MVLSGSKPAKAKVLKKGNSDDTFLLSDNNEEACCLLWCGRSCGGVSSILVVEGEALSVARRL
jgi:hypothetical protein